MYTSYRDSNKTQGKSEYILHSSLILNMGTSKGMIMKYKELVSTYNPGDIAMLHSLLDSEQIQYYVNGENFNRLQSMVQPARFMVSEDQFDEAMDLIKVMNINFLTINLDGEEDF